MHHLIRRVCSTTAASSSSFFSSSSSSSSQIKSPYSPSGGKQPVFPKKAKADGDATPFCDWRRVVCQAGRGGDGMISFRREANVPFGGPDGGDGGNGGHVLFEATFDTRDLAHLDPVIKARNGEYGRSKSQHGKGGEHRRIPVPVGTMLKDSTTGKQVAELSAAGQIFVAARGGGGGRGNQFFVSNSVRTPYKAEVGAHGETANYEVEMRVIAVAGFVGYPNAGKSSLLRAISRARPRVASYPFTTLSAHVGIVHYEDFVQIPVADIPGLIEGSHKNVGLGISFLRHIDRCHSLYYVLDLTLGRLKDQLDGLRYELEQYRAGLSNRRAAILLNKCDRFPELSITDVAAELSLPDPSTPVFAISAKHGLGLETMLVHLRGEYELMLEERRRVQEEFERTRMK